MGVGVRSFTLRLEMIAWGGTSPAPRKLPVMFFLVIDALYAAVKAKKNSTFVMWLIWDLTNTSISLPYAFLSWLKNPTSSGWVRWDQDRV